LLLNYVKRSVSGIAMRLTLCTFVLIVIAGCNSGGGSNESTDVPSPPASNSVPTISGSPPEQVTEGQPYSFTPAANDADGDTLNFSIENPPSWVNFDTVTGSISGIPGSDDIGTTANIIISVSDGSDSASLAPFDIEVLQVQLGSATVSWDIPTTNADGSDLEDLAGFDVYYRQEPAGYSRVAIVDDKTATSALIEDLEPGTWYFTVSAFDLTGNRSGESDEVSKVISP
jgi:hypothetical protein